MDNVVRREVKKLFKKKKNTRNERWNHIVATSAVGKKNAREKPRTLRERKKNGRRILREREKNGRRILREREKNAECNWQIKQKIWKI